MNKAKRERKREIWHLNAMHDPELDSGSEKKIGIKCIIKTIGETVN